MQEGLFDLHNFQHHHHLYLLLLTSFFRCCVLHYPDHSQNMPVLLIIQLVLMRTLTQLEHVQRKFSSLYCRRWFIQIPYIEASVLYHTKTFNIVCRRPHLETPALINFSWIFVLPHPVGNFRLSWAES
jgi:hypothetical protein